VLHTAGIGESLLDEAIGTELLEASNPTVGLAAHSGQVDVRITAKADSEMVANAMIEAAEAQLRQRIGAYVYGVDMETIEEALAAALREQDATLAINETGIEPVVSTRLRSLESLGTLLKSVRHFETTEALTNTLGIPDFPIRKLAEQVAEQISRESGATLGIAVISRTGLPEDRADADELSALAIYSGGKVISRSYGFSGNTDVARQWTSTWVMSMAWRLLRERLD
jgi:nicotinamide-nucleotide amidase